MNERALLMLGLVVAGASGKKPQELLSGLHGRVRKLQAEEPMNAAVLAVFAGAAVFYAAERGTNPSTV